MQTNTFIKVLIILITFLLLNLYLICTSNTVHAYYVEIVKEPGQNFKTLPGGFTQAGETSHWRESNILIRINASLDEDVQTETILHELSHVIFLRNFTPKERRVYAQIYKANKGRGCGTEYGAKNDWECYSELSTLMFAGKIKPREDMLYIYTNALMLKYKQKYLDILKTQ